MSNFWFIWPLSGDFIYGAAEQGSYVTFQYHDLLLTDIDCLKEMLALITVSRILS